MSYSQLLTQLVRKAMTTLATADPERVLHEGKRGSFFLDEELVRERRARLSRLDTEERRLSEPIDTEALLRHLKIQHLPHRPRLVEEQLDEAYREAKNDNDTGEMVTMSRRMVLESSLTSFTYRKDRSLCLMTLFSYPIGQATE